ncbi:MAG: glycosyltransferase family 39 protein [Gammaproteobacteria bacterium]
MRLTSPALWLLLALAWFATIGVRPLLEPDEGRYSEIPREMSATGDWVTPRLNGIKYFEKPPLQYWGTAAAYSLFGVTEWTARLWACSLAFLCIPLVYTFSRYLYQSESVAAAAAAALAINPYFAIVGQLNILDSGFCFFLVASVFAYLRAGASSNEPRAERRWMVLAALALALAVLTKGIAALVLAGGTAVIHMLVTRNVRALRRWHLVATLPVFLAVTVPWFLVVSARNPEFPEFFFIHEHFARYLTDVSDRVEPWWFFGPYVLLAVLPWIPSGLRSLRGLFAPPRSPASSQSRRWFKAREWDERQSNQAFLLIWCVFVLLFFTASRSKLPTYILPLVPMLAVLLAPRIAERAAGIRKAAWVMAAVVVIVAAGLVVFAARKNGIVPIELFVWCGVAAFVAVAAAAAARRGWAVAAVGAILAIQGLLMGYANLAPLRTAKPLVAEVRPFIGPETELFSVNQYRQSVAPYLGATLRMVGYRGELDFGLTQEPAGFIPSLERFAEEWSARTDAVAFVDPAAFEVLRAREVPMHVVARDARSVVVARKEMMASSK